MEKERKVRPIPASVTDWRQLSSSEYLGHWDLPVGKRAKVSISAINIEDVMNPADFKTEEKVVLSFTGKEKRFILNKTNFTAIASWHGQNPHEWIGKEIELYRTTVKLKGVPVEAIRVAANDKKTNKDRSASAAANLE